MQTFKKLLLSVISFLLVFSLVSAIVIVPYYNSEATYYQDGNLRSSLAGKIDYVTIGASHCLAGFDSTILDEELGCFSYNLSVSMMPMYAKYVLLKKEFDRNPIKTVVLELSYDTLQRRAKDEFAIGDEPMIAKLDTWQERAHYLLRYVSLNDWLNVYSRSFVQGLWNWKNIMTGQTGNQLEYGKKGFHMRPVADITLSQNAAQKRYNSRKYVSVFHDDNEEWFIKTIELCKSMGARVIIAVVPVSDGMIWSYDCLDDFVNWANDFSKAHGCEFYDFNLVKDRYALFSDSHSFSDADHMSIDGAEVFSRKYCDVMQKIDAGQDVQNFFYDSYEEMKAASPYANESS